MRVFTLDFKKYTFVSTKYTSGSRNLTLALGKYTKIHFPNPPLEKPAKIIRK